MAFKPTASQKEAIETRGSTVLVSAGAGSGKTRVLTERLMAYVSDEENPADLDSFLIITFTRAAAGELRGRIMDELALRLAEDPSNRRLRRQSALCQRAEIGTIHSFCASLLRRYSHMAGLTPDFKIVDEDRASSMMSSALEKVLDERYENMDRYPGFRALADTVGAGRDDRRLAEITLKLHGKMQSHARPEKWAREQITLLRADYDDAAQTPWGEEILGWAKQSMEYWSRELDRLMEEMVLEEKISKAYMPCISAMADFTRELGRCLKLGWDKSRDCFPFEGVKLGVLRNSPNPALSDKVKQRRDACKKSIENIGKALSAPSDKLLKQLSLGADAMEALLMLTLDFDREYSREKRRCSLVDYSDLEHITAQLLTDENDEPTELARQVSLKYTEIMVDEYQDVNRVQDSIFRAVSKNGKNLLMVGDVKQSVYRFRLADPGIFTEKYLSYADYWEAKPGQPRRIMLQENFRSRREILNAANSLFSLCMSRGLGEIDYDEAAALKYGASYEAEVPVPELLLLPVEKGSDDEESPDKTAIEAAFVAKKIKSLVESGVQVNDRGNMRPLQYSDVAILLRSVNTVGGVYRRELSQAGVPVASGQGGAFFSSVEISTMMSLLAVIDDPHQDIALIAVLRSPAYSFSADELSEIRSSDKRGDFYSALCLKSEDNEKCRKFLKDLEEFRSIAPDMLASELVWYLIDRLDMTAICSAMSDGAQRRARLMELVDMSEHFEGTGYRGLHRFVQYLKKQEERGAEPSLGSDGSLAVQIMSIHKSKGLEFPVVFLCDTARRFNKSDGSETVLIHPQLGLGPKVIDPERRVEFPGLERNAIKLRLEKELLSEEMRLLYVAMTRPKERFFITAAIKDVDKKLEKAAALISKPMEPEVLRGASAYSDWLIWAALADGGENIAMRVCAAESSDAGAETEETRHEADPLFKEKLMQYLQFSYPYKEAQELPSKITATELKGRAEKDEDAVSIAPKKTRDFRMPDLGIEEKPLSAAQRGTATHLVLQYMDFSKTGSLQEVKEEIHRMFKAGFMTAREAQAVDAEAIYGMFASALGKRMLSAEKMQREFKFSLLCDAGEVFGTAEGEELLLQGVVDCFIEEDGELVVIDYKTDLVRNEAELMERRELYSKQIRAYAMALERICQKPVKEAVLYFLSVGKACEISLKKQ
ncbi:MAG: helicase-exonuclease AddAB subunit AddA [Oscillospiraceae bacterium]|nr:helicase-exonuclease AddAB subunit AddA [Oscillospiraceae bacterium]